MMMMMTMTMTNGDDGDEKGTGSDDNDNDEKDGGSTWVSSLEGRSLFIPSQVGRQDSLLCGKSKKKKSKSPTFTKYITICVKEFGNHSNTIYSDENPSTSSLAYSFLLHQNL